MSSMIGSTGYRGPTGSSSGQSMTGAGNIIPKGYKQGQIQQFSPDQMQLFQQLFGNLGSNSFLSRLAGGDQSMFEQMEAPAMRQFQGLQGQNASRFSGMGMGARRSSGFQNYQGQQTADFAQQLQANRMGLQRQSIMDLHELAQQLLGQRPYSQFLVEKQQKGGLGGPIGAGLGALGGFFAGGPAGAFAGGQLGYNVGSSF